MENDANEGGSCRDKMREALVKAKKAICRHAEHACQSLSWENSTINANCGDVLCAHRDLCEAKTAIDEALAELEGSGREKATETGNVKDMRDALVQCELFLGNVSRHGHPTLNPGDKCTACDGVDELRGMVVRALSAPARNCDAATAELLDMRYKAFCRKHYTPNQLGGNCRKCPLKDRRGWSCELAWAQMPYAQEGGVK